MNRFLNMKTLLAAAGSIAILTFASSAFAVEEGGGDQPAPTTPVSTGPIPVTGNVPALCSFGQINTDVGPFALGTLIDTTTGLLRSDLNPTPKTITGSWCNAQSTLNVSAVVMTAQNFVGDPPANFSTGVHFTATASGWTPSNAVFSTGTAGAQAAATQTQNLPNAGTITLSLSQFATRGGPTLRPVADTAYEGTVTLTLTPVA
jgi:hypothetical protein